MIVTGICFPGNCEEAINFYKETLGAKVEEIAYFRDAPPDHGMDDSLPPDFVMHSELIIFGTKIIMTDGAEADASGGNFDLNIFLDAAEEVEAVFNKLAEGGTVIAPLASTYWWADMYGFVTDRFGVSWSVMK